MNTRPRRAPPVLWPVLGLVLLLLADSLLHPGFLRVTLQERGLYGIPVDILNQGSRVMLLALGMTAVIATGGVDLSVGSLMAVAGMACAVALRAGLPLGVALAAAVGAGALGGAVNGLLVAGLGLQPIVATLILMVAGRGVAQLITAGRVVALAGPALDFLADGRVLGLPVAPLLVLALYGVAWLFLRRTAAGLFVAAVGDSATASRFAGLAAGRIVALAYVASGACAGLAGVLAAANTREADPNRAGENMELDAIFAVVVGGTALTGGRFSLLGSLVGALLLQAFTTTLYNFGVAPAVASVPKAVLILAVALLQSDRLRRWLASLAPGRARP